MISDKRFTEIADQFAGFTFSSLQAFDQIVDRLKKYGHSVEDMQQYVQENRNAVQTKYNFAEDWKQGKIIVKKCPECGTSMLLESVNTCKGNQLPMTNYKSVFTCPMYNECGYQEWNLESVGMAKFNHLKKNGTFEKYRPKKFKLHESEIEIEDPDDHFKWIQIET